MPEISRFYGIVIKMYYNDHAPPHLHAEFGEHELVVACSRSRYSRARCRRACVRWFWNGFRCIRTSWHKIGIVAAPARFRQRLSRWRNFDTRRFIARADCHRGDPPEFPCSASLRRRAGNRCGFSAHYQSWRGLRPLVGRRVFFPTEREFARTVDPLAGRNRLLRRRFETGSLEHSGGSMIKHKLLKKQNWGKRG